MALASSSLPVPLSPSSSTVVSLAATRDAVSVTAAHGSRPGDHAREREALAHDLPQLPVLAGERAQLEGLAHRGLQLVARERLGQVVEGADLHRLDRRVDRAVRGQHDDRAGPAASPSGASAARRRPSRASGRRSAPGRRPTPGSAAARSGRRRPSPPRSRPRAGCTRRPAAGSRRRRSGGPSSGRSWQASDGSGSPDSGSGISTVVPPPVPGVDPDLAAVGRRRSAG